MSQSYRSLSESGSHFLRSRHLRYAVVVLCVSFSFSSILWSTSGQQSRSLRRFQTGRGMLAFQQTPQPTLQRRSTPPTTNARSVQCQQQQAEWINNLPSRSFVTGAIAFFILLVFLFTPLGFSRPFVRMFAAFVVAILVSPTIVGFQKHSALRVCPEPPTFLSILTADLFIWTLAGIVAIALLLVIIRYPLTKRRLNTRPTA